MIELKEISFKYNQALVLKNINLTMNTDEIIGIIGESGSGKTTLAHILLGLLQPKQGDIFTNDLTLLPIFQHAYDSFNPKFNMEKSFKEPINHFKFISPHKVQQRLKELMVYMQLDSKLLDRFPSELSGGQLQRLNTIRTLMLEPDILVCDEITASLDVIAEQKMVAVLKDYHQRTNKGMLIISHDIAFLNQLVERLIVMKNGEIVDDFSMEHLLSEQRHAYTKQLLSIY
ncbi:ATP-binding cassette domain-containing protein [Staphylococcus aureus]